MSQAVGARDARTVKPYNYLALDYSSGNDIWSDEQHC